MKEQEEKSNVSEELHAGVTASIQLQEGLLGKGKGIRIES